MQRWRAGEDASHVLGEDGALGFAAWCLRQRLPFGVEVEGAGLIQDDRKDFAAAAAESDYRVWKVKIGVRAIRDEQRYLDALLDATPPESRFRLDANGQLDGRLTGDWLDWMENRDRIELLEQPLPAGEEQRMMETLGERMMRVALDESVVARERFLWALDRGWSGWWVIKPSLFGAPDFLFSLPEAVRKRMIVSSAFESGVGFSFVLRVAELLGGFEIAHGLGTRGKFGEDGLDGWSPARRFKGLVTQEGMERVFES